MKPLKIIMPLPSHDFDPTEAAVSWKIVHDAGHEVVFATPDGKRGFADPLMITGEGLDPWGWIPGIKKIKIFGLLLRAAAPGLAAYSAMEEDANFLNPKAYEELSIEDYDGMILPGGHAPLMKEYLENQALQSFVADFFDSVDESGNHKPIAAVCHGVVLAVRSISKKTNKSVLHGRKTTALTWDLERSAWLLTRFWARFWDSGYYRTYMESGDEPTGYWSVEAEVKRGLANDADFLTVPKDSINHFQKDSGMFRDAINDDRPAWVVHDGNYISARWPGDVHTFARRFVELLGEYYK